MNGEFGPELLDTAVEWSLLDGHDGRSGARLERVRLADGTRLVVKRSRASADLAMRLSGDREGRELQLWSSGVLDRLPATVGHAVVAGWREDEEVVVVIRDLGDAVIGWDTPIGRTECRRIFAAAAAMHNAFAGQHVAGLCPLRTRLSLFASDTLYSLAADDHPLVGAAQRGWERFAELVPSDVADAVTAFHADPGPLADALVARGTTLTHGDLWLVNAALQPDRIVLVDWGLATEAPGAVDFATFLMGASAVTASRDDLVDDVRRIQGSAHDETALRLALLAAVVDLGWNKALDATEHSDPSVHERETAELSWWVRAARSGLDVGPC